MGSLSALEPSKRTISSKRDMNNQQHYTNTMASQEFFELVEVAPQQQYEFEMDSQGYSPSEISSDHDYVPVEHQKYPMINSRKLSSSDATVAAHAIARRLPDNAIDAWPRLTSWRAKSLL